MKKHFLVLSLLAAAAVPASADGVYIFGDLGQSKLSIDSDGWSTSKTANTYSFGVGYAVNPIVSFELAYRDLGKVTTFADSDEKETLDGSSLQASVLASLPVSDVVNIFGRVGIAELTYDYKYQDFEDSYYNDSGSESKNKAFIGVGASYSLSDNVSLRAEYNRYKSWDESTASSLTIGAVYSF